MTTNDQPMRMPELLVFARSFAIGFIAAEVWRAAFIIGSNFAQTSSWMPPWVQVAIVIGVLLLCSVYSVERHAPRAAARIGSSFRVDLLAAVGTGVWVNELALPWLARVHTALENADPNWAPSVLFLLCVTLISPLKQRYWPRRAKSTPQLYFAGDEEIGDEAEDLLGSQAQAKSFAETVLASSSHQGLVFGVDGPWGVGKTSFINLAQRHWDDASDSVIVCRFEPLRYASEPDLADRIIRELSAAIQRKVFVPEFRPAATRYARLIKGKADISFLGFKLSLEPSQETVDDLLEEIDEVLKRIGRRVIIVIDDLDRLDAKTTNNVLFATRRTFKLSQATYVLCYDTEVLANRTEETSKTREFLEKFVAVKLSLFIDSSRIRDFLLRDWQRTSNQLRSIPSDTMIKLGSVLSELANILDDNLAPEYLPLVGDLRKVKRFVNAMLLMQIERSDLTRTDFNERDLINLMLLHLNYPGLFRRIYAEETEGRCGAFSVRHHYIQQGQVESKNSDELASIIDGQQEAPAKFLLKQLFDVTSLRLDGSNSFDEATLASRACFNDKGSRNLENYLKLIVRFITPEPQNTFVLYEDAIEQARNGTPIASILQSPNFRLDRGQKAHDKFWTLLVNQSHQFTDDVVDDAIDTLIDFLPRYSTVEVGDNGLRQRLIYDLLRLLDRVGWRTKSGRRQPNTPENVVEIAWRIFGERRYKGTGILKRLIDGDRGVLGWHDLMMFRLSCSEDRQGQLYQIYTALIVHREPSAPTNGDVRQLALVGMASLSQEVFALFKQTYIDPQRNFISEVRDTSDEAFLGEASGQLAQRVSDAPLSEQDAASFAQQIAGARSAVQSFVLYQLSNSLPPNGSGVGCGYYDEHGTGDGGGIAKQMNQYLFGVCFNPTIDESNVLHFIDYCLLHLSSAFDSSRDGRYYRPSKAELPGGLDPKEMGLFWHRHNATIRQQASLNEDRRVTTYNYTASYSEDLPEVFAVLDELAVDATST